MGPSLTDKVDTFIGIAGANLGLVNCWMMPIADTCNEINGFYPGSNDSTDLSAYLKGLNQNLVKEGAIVYSIFSTADELIGFGDVVWGRYTSKWPTEDQVKIYDDWEYSHIATRDLTKTDQYDLITHKKFSDTPTSKPKPSEEFLQ